LSLVTASIRNWHRITCEGKLHCRAIKNDENIKGISVGDKVIKVSLYADDTTAFVRNLDYTAHSLTLVQKIKNLSGLEINTTKTEGMWLGNWKNTTKSLSAFAGHGYFLF